MMKMAEYHELFKNINKVNQYSCWDKHFQLALVYLTEFLINQHVGAIYEYQQSV